MQKYRSKKAWPTSRDRLLVLFVTPTTSIEQLNIHISNLVRRLTTRGTMQKRSSWCVD